MPADLVAYLDGVWGPHSIDRFATTDNRRTLAVPPHGRLLLAFIPRSSPEGPIRMSGRTRAQSERRRSAPRGAEAPGWRLAGDELAPLIAGLAGPGPCREGGHHAPYHKQACQAVRDNLVAPPPGRTGARLSTASATPYISLKVELASRRCFGRGAANSMPCQTRRYMARRSSSAGFRDSCGGGCRQARAEALYECDRA